MEQIDKKRSIGDVAKEIGLETHVIRFWESKFPQIKPEIGAGKRRYYYNKQFKVLKRIRQFLYEDGYTIAGLQKLLKKRKQHGDYKDEDLDLILEGSIHENFTLDDFIVDENQLQKKVSSVRKNLAKLKSLLT